MKNLLVLFLVSFALFWVGCEKEEMGIHEIGSSQNISTAYSEGSWSEADATALTNLLATKENELSCCQFIGSNEYESTGVPGQANINTFFITPEDNPSPAATNSNRVVTRLFLNGVLFNSSDYSQPGLVGDVNDPERFAWDMVQEDFPYGGCPYNVRVEYELYEVSDGNEYVECEKYSYDTNVKYIVDPNSEPCPLEEAGPCFDDFGNPIRC